MITDHHLDPHSTHWLPWLCVTLNVCMLKCASVYNNNNNNKPFSSYMADTCRKPRLCKVKSGPFRHEIQPCWCMYATKHVTCVSVCVCVLLWMLDFTKGVKACTEVHLSSGGDTRHSDKSIMWSCFTVGGGEHNKACEGDKCVFVRMCMCVRARAPPSRPDVSHI